MRLGLNNSQNLKVLTEKRVWFYAEHNGKSLEPLTRETTWTDLHLKKYLTDPWNTDSKKLKRKKESNSDTTAELPCQCREHRFNPWFGKIHWKRTWQSTRIFVPGESYGQRRLLGYSQWGCKESMDRTEWLSMHVKCSKWEMVEN